MASPQGSSFLLASPWRKTPKDSEIVLTMLLAPIFLTILLREFRWHPGVFVLLYIEGPSPNLGPVATWVYPPLTSGLLANFATDYSGCRTVTLKLVASLTHAAMLTLPLITVHSANSHFNLGGTAVSTVGIFPPLLPGRVPFPPRPPLMWRSPAPHSTPRPLRTHTRMFW